MDDIFLADNQAARRYELRSGGAVAAHADYQLRDGVVALIHTGVLPAHEGKGLGSKLAKFALDDVRQRGLKVEARCSFMATWIERHPDYASLVDASPR